MKLDKRFDHPVIACWGDAVEGHRVQVLDKQGKVVIVKDEEILSVAKQMKPVCIRTRRGSFDTANYILLSLTTMYDNSPEEFEEDEEKEI